MSDPTKYDEPEEAFRERLQRRAPDYVEATMPRRRRQTLEHLFSNVTPPAEGARDKSDVVKPGWDWLRW